MRRPGVDLGRTVRLAAAHIAQAPQPQPSQPGSCAQAVPNSNRIAGEVPEPGLTLPSVNSAIGEERAPSCRNPLSPAVADSQQKRAFRT